MGNLRRRTALGVALTLFACLTLLPATAVLAEDAGASVTVVQGAPESETIPVSTDPPA